LVSRELEYAPGFSNHVHDFREKQERRLNGRSLGMPAF
jgi:hypothetical protein